MNKFLKEFKDRGFFYQCTGEENLSQLLDKEKIRAYIGFDCTAESLHVGSLLQIMCLRLLQKHGHQPIVLLGGGTTRIGDPSGKDKTRTILSEEEIEKNINNIEKILHLGDILITFGDFLENNAQLIPSGYVEEIWIEELKQIISKSKPKNQYLEQFLTKLPSVEDALKISIDFQFSLHPHYLYYWDKISSEELIQLLQLFHQYHF